MRSQFAAIFRFGSLHSFSITRLVITTSLGLLLVALSFRITIASGLMDSPEPDHQLLLNGNFEQRNLNSWGKQGGTVAAENCCGQHETPFWGKGATGPYGDPLL